MEIEKLYCLYKIQITYGKRSLIYNIKDWTVTYVTQDNIQSFELTNDRLNKVIDKYHQNQWGFRKSYVHLETEMR